MASTIISTQPSLLPSLDISYAVIPTVLLQQEEEEGEDEGEEKEGNEEGGRRR